MIWYPKHFCWNKKKLARPTLFLAAKIWIFVFQDVSFFCPTVATIAAHNATSVLNQNNHTTFHKFTRYVLVTRVTLLLYKRGFAALYQKKPTRVWKPLEASFFPTKHGIVVLYFREVRRHFGFVWRVSSLTSWRGIFSELMISRVDFGGFAGIGLVSY